MNEIDPAIRIGLRTSWKGLSHSKYGTCALCGRNREGVEEHGHKLSERTIVGKPLYLYGHSDDLCICFDCFAERGGSAPKQPKRPPVEGRERAVVEVAPTEDEQETIERIVQLRKQGLGYPKIAEALNGASIPTFGRPGAKWHGPTVRAILIKVTGSVEGALALAQQDEAVAA